MVKKKQTDLPAMPEMDTVAKHARRILDIELEITERRRRIREEEEREIASLEREKKEAEAEFIKAATATGREEIKMPEGTVRIKKISASTEVEVKKAAGRKKKKEVDHADQD